MRNQRGSAVVDFVLVLAVLVPLFLGILQLALVLMVRNTLSSAAAEGARLAATYDHDLTVPEHSMGYRWDIVLSGRNRTWMEPEEPEEARQ